MSDCNGVHQTVLRDGRFVCGDCGLGSAENPWPPPPPGSMTLDKGRMELAGWKFRTLSNSRTMILGWGPHRPWWKRLLRGEER